MSSQTAEITWTTNDAAVLRSHEKMERNMDTLARKLDNIERASKKAAKATEQGFDAATMKVAGFVTAVTGVGSVLAGAQAAANQLKAEWENLKNQQKSAADANLKLADVLPSTYRQAGGLLSGKEIEDSVKRISQSTGTGQVKVAQAIGEALAARGATNKAEANDAIKAAEAALKFAPESDAATIASLAGGTTDLQRRFGVSAEQSIGFLARVGGQARVTSLREQVQNLNPAIGALTQFGASPQFAGGLVSTMTGATGDFTGAISATASIQLAKQLEDRGFATPEQGIAALQADPKLREAFFKGGNFGGKKFSAATFEAKALPALRQLLTGGSDLANNLSAATREVGTFQQGGQTYREMIREVGNLSPVRLANLQRRFSQAGEELRIGNVIGAEGAITREGFNDLLDASGAGSLEKTFLSSEFELASGGGTRSRVTDVASALRKRAQFITRTEDYGSAGVGGQGVRTPRTVTAEDSARGETLTRVAALLEEIARETKGTREATERQSQGPRAKDRVESQHGR